MSNREPILARLATVLQGVADTLERGEFKRNDINVRETHDTLLLFDGDESTAQDLQGRDRPRSGPAIVTALPEIYIVLAKDSALVGTALNALYEQIITAIMYDEQLGSLTKDQDGIIYEGSQTALALGRAMVGEMGLNFAFRYVWKPTPPEPASEPVSEP